MSNTIETYITARLTDQTARRLLEALHTAGMSYKIEVEGLVAHGSEGTVDVVLNQLPSSPTAMFERATEIVQG